MKYSYIKVFQSYVMTQGLWLTPEQSDIKKLIQIQFCNTIERIHVSFHKEVFKNTWCMDENFKLPVYIVTLYVLKNRIFEDCASSLSF